MTDLTVKPTFSSPQQRDSSLCTCDIEKQSQILYWCL